MHLTKIPSGMWRVTVSKGGQRRTATAPTRTEAQQAGAELLLEMGGSTRRRNATVAELLAAWQTDSDLSITFRADAVRVIDRLPETFTSRRAVDVTPSIIEGLYRQLAKAGWSAHRIGRAHTVLSSAYSLGRRWEWVRDNPFTAARKPTVVKPDLQPPTPEQVSTLINAANPRLRLYLLLAAAVGARRGEVVGLQWADISDDAVIIRRALAYAPQQGVVTTDGKTGSKGHRVVALDPELSKLLGDHRREQVELALRAGLPKPKWVFSHDAGVTPWRPDFVSREFRRLRTSTGMPAHIRLHDLRHYVATQLLASGVPLKTVSARLGHRQVSTTADRYAHYVPAADQVAADVMASLRQSRSTG